MHLYRTYTDYVETRTKREIEMSEWYATYKTDPRTGGHFFSWKGQETFATEADLDRAIKAWKAIVTPRMAEGTTFEKRRG